MTQIAREPDAAADHDLMMRTFTAEPFSGARHNLCKFHHLLARHLVFELADLVAQSGGRFVIFFRHRFFEVIVQGAHFVA